MIRQVSNTCRGFSAGLTDPGSATKKASGAIVFAPRQSICDSLAWHGVILLPAVWPYLKARRAIFP
jgi:hypothetical protein